MAPLSIGSPRPDPQRSGWALRRLNLSLPVWTNPEVLYWLPEWRLIRDCIEGERVIKERAHDYLPQPEGQEEEDYKSYLTRATFYNFTGRTISALTGSIFRREPTITGIPTRLESRLAAVTKTNQPFHTLLSEAVEENIALGRVGVLLDMPAGPTTDPKPYFVTYTAENILEWQSTDIDGRLVPTLYVLRECEEARTDDGKLIVLPIFRKLSLEFNEAAKAWQYRVDIYRTPLPTEGKKVEDLYPNPFAGPPVDPKDTIYPEVRGKRLDYIPFCIMGPFKSTLEIEKPPSQDIARLNVSHYRSYAELENSRFMVGSPMYWVENPQGTGGKNTDFVLGAMRIFEVPPGSKPGIVEMNGQGLKFLENALDQKEQQAAALGGRMMGVRGQAVSESDNQLKLAERNEQSVLLKLTVQSDHGFTKLVRWWAMWQGIPADEADKIKIQLNKDFLFDGIGAREFRAVHAMYKDGHIPIEVLYHYLRKGDVIPDWMDITEFKSLVDNMESFPNNPDVEAKKAGYPDAQARFQEEQNELNRELELEIANIEADTTTSEGDKDRKIEEAKNKAAEKTRQLAAKAAANRPAPAAPAARPAARPPVR